MVPALLLIPLVALLRILFAWEPQWAVGFSPLAGVGLCAGLFLPRRLALVVPVAILLASDIVIDLHYGVGFFVGSLLARYALLAIIVLAGMLLGETGRPAWAVLSGTVIGSTFFYVASNTLTWAGSPDYPQTLAGFWQALTTGLPHYPPSYLFFRNGLVSDLLYSIVFLACVHLTRPAWRSEFARFLSVAVRAD